MFLLAGKKQLPPVRVASEDDIPVPPKSLIQAFNDGDRLNELMAKRRILIAHIENENTLARDLNALMRQDDELSKQIAEEKAIRAEASGREISRMEVSRLDAYTERFDPHTA